MKAFPIQKDVLGSDYCGMDLRDYFAAKAMQAMLSDQTYDSPMDRLTKLSYQFADSMMKAREQ